MRERRRLSRKNSSGSTDHQPSSILEDGTPEQGQQCSRFVIREKHPIRSVWNVVVALLLLYTATVFPYKLSFLDFKVTNGDEPDSSVDPGWNVVEKFVDVLFYIDLLMSFLFTFRDENHVEVVSLPRIALRYLRSTFSLNLVACMPSDVEGLVAPWFGKSSGPRVAPLVRLVRLVRLAKLVSFMTDSPLWRWLQRQRGVQIFNFLVGLLGVVHLTACGWYLCSALHHDQTVTWLGRRMVFGDEGTRPLLEADAVEQWFHSMYFVLVVFTTTGFGDIYAITIGEIMYVCAMMIIGAVVHSIVVSKMINIVTNADQESLEVSKKRELVQRFAQHVQLGHGTAQELTRLISQSQAVLEGFDQEQMRKLLMLSLPDKMMEKLHGVIFQGKLVKNRLISVCKTAKQRLPPRLPLLVALLVHSVSFEEGDMVYYWADHPWSVFVVLEGVFAYVARPHPAGGICEVPCGPRNQVGQRASVVDDQPAAAQTAGTPTQEKPPTLCPYMIFSIGNYFGEFEMFVAKPRISSVRCEKPGTLLVMSKAEFHRLADEFPHIAELWKARALSREGHRKASLRRLTVARQVEDFAAYSIQRHMRKHITQPQSSSGLDTLVLDNRGTFGQDPDKSKDGSEGSDLQRFASDDGELQADVDALRREVRAGNAELRQTIEAIERLLGMKGLCDLNGDSA